MKGEWQGSGTWTTTGSSGNTIVLSAVGGLVLIGTIEFIVARIWWLIGSTLTLGVLSIAAWFFLIRPLIRWQEGREAEFGAKLAASATP